MYILIDIKDRLGQVRGYVALDQWVTMSVSKREREEKMKENKPLASFPEEMLVA